ncbi:Mediator of RNA polymerase II transcription subunit 28 [Microtus ochrogaster]|uniref:Mediator of RNA polymerase II transcription subunit 28 n=1 Tax=Microtus ochrogaster TaxID=79684 RepID=A0A8J6GR54_MICOH|nr:Mediator of RNA polymerase II transcription subunit 28 [Microtus ochrogaster]
MFSGQPPGPPPPPPGLPGQASLLQAAPGAPRPSNSTLVDELESSFEVSRAVGVPVQPSEVTPVSVVPAPRGCRGSESRSRCPRLAAARVRRPQVPPHPRPFWRQLTESRGSLDSSRRSALQACFASLVSQDYVNGTDQEEIRTGVDQCIQKFLDIARQTECFFLQKRLQLSVQKPDQVIKEDVSELRSELQRKDALVQKHLTKLRHWQQVLEDINVQHKKPAEIPQGSLAYLEQASANIPAPLKPT